MAVVFPQIFLDFHPSCKFTMHVPINGISWKVTLDKRIYIWFVLHLSDETLLLKLFPPSFPFATYSRDSKLNILTTICSYSDYPIFSAKAQGLIYNLGPHPYNYYYLHFFNIHNQMIIIILISHSSINILPK